MNRLFLVTGATGHIGTVLVNELLKKGERVRILVHPEDRAPLPEGTEVCRGDVTEPGSLRAFFDRKDDCPVSLIHCAARITIASKEDPRVWETNVNGTRNIMDLAAAAGIERVIHISSVHAIPELPKGEIITEVDSFSPDLVDGQYAKSKAAASQLVLDHASRGLNVSIIHPSGLIGPGDTMRRNHMIRTIQDMASGAIPAAVEGGYDLVDARDVVSGILGCEKQGRPGECYILSGHYISILELLNMIRKMTGKRPVKIELPYGFVKTIAPLTEKIAVLLRQKPPIFTPYSLATLQTNAAFSHEKATREFDYHPRLLKDSVQASL